MKGLKVRIADAHVTQLEIVVVRRALEKAERVAVPGGGVEVLRKRVVIEVAERAHEIMQDRCVRRMTPDDLRLPSVEGDDLIGRETLKIQQMRRIGLGHGQIRQLDLVEASTAPSTRRHCPRLRSACRSSDISPRTIAEMPQRGRRIAFHRVVAAIFIVGLPGRDAGMTAESSRQMLDDALAFLRVAFVAEAIVAARAEFARSAPRRRAPAYPASCRRAISAASPSACRARPSGRRDAACRWRGSANRNDKRPRSARAATRRIRQSEQRRDRSPSSWPRPRSSVTEANVPDNSKRQGVDVSCADYHLIPYRRSDAASP